ncbi:MAG: anhydro-N-acetylmuramic acid kinase, partial [Paracoccaceae bacterium]|nr:anhydro-N-acetylmuramic acid kinase [Paracoccaceae bacterium]
AVGAAGVGAGWRPRPPAPARVLVGGGGRHNAALMAALGQQMSCPVAPVEAVGLDGDMLEAQAFGFLAARVCAGLPLSAPLTTGVPAPTLGGQIARPPA